MFKCGMLLCLIMSIQANKIKLHCGAVVVTIFVIHIHDFISVNG